MLRAIQQNILLGLDRLWKQKYPEIVCDFIVHSNKIFMIFLIFYLYYSDIFRNNNNIPH